MVVLSKCIKGGVVWCCLNRAVHKPAVQNNTTIADTGGRHVLL